jgi:DNA-binding transcriptional LysR family regulator
MELRTLGYFVAVVDAGSVSAAADVVHVTQPAISRQLRQLEHDLGVDLFTRSAGRLRLSAAGRELLPYARDVLRRAEGARAVARSYAAGRLERLTIVAPTTTLTDVIAPFLSTLTADDPMPTVLESGPLGAREALDRGADLVIVTEPPRGPLASAPIAVLPVWAYVPAGHPLSGTAVRLRDLVDETLLVLAPSFKPRQILDRAIDQARLAAADLVECSNPQVAQALAAAGRGVAIVTDDPRFDLRGAEIVGRDGPLRIELFAVWEAEHHAAAALAALTGRLADFCVERYGAEVAPA